MDRNRPLRILVVDDNDANRAFAAAVMEDEGFEVQAAASANAGLRVFSTFQPDCVLLDVKMPDKDGFEACGELRALPLGDAVTIVFVTAVRNAEIFERAIQVGGDDCIAKPVLPTELIGRVRLAVRARALSVDMVKLHENLGECRDELIRLDAVAAGFRSSSLHGALDRLTHHVDQMLTLSADAPRGA